jgi:hypothetical protein
MADLRPFTDEQSRAPSHLPPPAGGHLPGASAEKTS